MLQNKWNDGDSFHVVWEGKEFLFRLYFVDTPETEKTYADRIAEQAAYFGITPEQLLNTGASASDFTKRALTDGKFPTSGKGKDSPVAGKKGFTIWTAWRKALGRSAIQRYYAIIEVDGKDLGEALVSQGLARIHGVRITRPDGTVSRTYLLKLQFMESEAKKREWEDGPQISGENL